MIVIIKEVKTSNKRNSFGVNLDEYTQSIPTLQVKEPTNLYVVTSEIFLHNLYIENTIYTLPFCNNLPFVTNFKNSCTHTLSNEYFTKVLFVLRFLFPMHFGGKRGLNTTNITVHLKMGAWGPLCPNYIR